VVDQRNSDDYAMKQSEFFKAFRAGGDLVKGSSEPLMLKVKDYPPDAAFAEQMPRHWQVSFTCTPCFAPYLLMHRQSVSSCHKPGSCK